MYDSGSIGRRSVGWIKNKQGMVERELMMKRERVNTTADMLNEDSLQLMNKVLIPSTCFIALSHAGVVVVKL